MTVRMAGWSRGPVVAVCALTFASMCSVALRADDEALKKDLAALVEGGGKGLTDEISGLIAKRKEAFVESLLATIEKHVGARVSALEKEVKAREARIAALEREIGELGKALASAKAGTAHSNAFLGIGHVALPENRRKEVGADGLLVTQVIAGSPAAQAGLKEGDVVLQLNGSGVSSKGLSAAVGAIKPGSTVSVEIVRGGKKESKQAKLVDRDSFFAAASKAPPSQKPVKLGILLAQRGDNLELDSVDAKKTASVAGLKAGDTLVKLNGKDVKTIDDVEAGLHGVYEGQEFGLTIRRGDETIEIVVIGSAGTEGAKLVSSKSQKTAAETEPKKAEPKPEPKKTEPEPKKPATLGLDVLPENDVLKVVGVVDGAAAAAVGIQNGDVLKSIGGEAAASVEAVQNQLKNLVSGDSVDLVVVRDGKDIALKNVVLGAEGEKVPVKPKPGVMLILARESSDNAGQVVINEVTEPGPGAAAGLQIGDVIVKMAGKDIKSFADIDTALGTPLAGDKVKLVIQRGEETIEVELTLVADE